MESKHNNFIFKFRCFWDNVINTIWLVIATFLLILFSPIIFIGFLITTSFGFLRTIHAQKKYEKHLDLGKDYVKVSSLDEN